MESRNYCALFMIKKICTSDWIIKTNFKTWLNFKKVHFVVKFKQKRWLEQFISSSNYVRTITENNFEKDTNKLLYNSIFIKSIQTE